MLRLYIQLSKHAWYRKRLILGQWDVKSWSWSWPDQMDISTQSIFFLCSMKTGERCSVDILICLGRKLPASTNCLFSWNRCDKVLSSTFTKYWTKYFLATYLTIEISMWGSTDSLFTVPWKQGRGNFVESYMLIPVSCWTRYSLPVFMEQARCTSWRLIWPRCRQVRPAD